MLLVTRMKRLVLIVFLVAVPALTNRFSPPSALPDVLAAGLLATSNAG